MQTHCSLRLGRWVRFNPFPLGDVIATLGAGKLLGLSRLFRSHKWRVSTRACDPPTRMRTRWLRIVGSSRRRITIQKPSTKSLIENTYACSFPGAYLPEPAKWRRV